MGAEEIRLMKPTTDRTNIMEYFTVATMHDFCCKDPRDQGGNNDDTDGSNASDGNHDVIFRDQTGLFSPKDLGLLMYRILGSICIDDDDDVDDHDDGDNDQDTKWKTTASLNEKKKKKK